MNLDEVRPGLEAFIADELGGTARLDKLTESDGHAGLTFLFDIVDGNSRAGYVVKLPPRGVRRQGNTDVYRQAPLLRALHADGLPVPRVPWAFESEDNAWFGLPFIVMERVPGYTFFVWDPAPGVPRDAATGQRCWTEAVRALARLHAFDWQIHLPDWEEPLALDTEINRWERIYAQAPETAWTEAAADTQRALLDNLPDGQPRGLFHGDFQPGNCLYDNGRLTAVIDWELSGIGAQLLDVGWLMMVADPDIWPPEWRPLHPLPLADIAAIYVEARGCDRNALPWYHALAAYRLACIACLNVKLHRTGKRHDPIWEHNAKAVMPMFEQARRLVRV